MFSDIVSLADFDENVAGFLVFLEPRKLRMSRSMSKPDDLDIVVDQLNALKAGDTIDVLVAGLPVERIGSGHWRIGPLGGTFLRIIQPALFYNEDGDYCWGNKGEVYEGCCFAWES